jgi:hypothetical protein
MRAKNLGNFTLSALISIAGLLNIDATSQAQTPRPSGPTKDIGAYLESVKQLLPARYDYGALMNESPASPRSGHWLDAIRNYFRSAPKPKFDYQFLPFEDHGKRMIDNIC